MTYFHLATLNCCGKTIDFEQKRIKMYEPTKPPGNKFASKFSVKGAL